MTTARARKPASRTWLGGLACGTLLATTPATALLVASLLLPTLVAYLMDQERRGGITRSVFICNLAGLAGPLIDLWHAGVPGLADALDVLAVPTTLVFAWVGAGTGWVVSELLVGAARVYLLIQDRRAAFALQADIAALVEEWDEPQTRSLPDEPA